MRWGGGQYVVLASVADRGGDAVGGPLKAPLQMGHGGRGSVRRVPDCQSRHDGFRHRRGRGYLGGHPRQFTSAPIPGKAFTDQLRGNAAGAGLVSLNHRVVPSDSGTDLINLLPFVRLDWAVVTTHAATGSVGEFAMVCDRGGRCGRSSAVTSVATMEQRGRWPTSQPGDRWW